MRVEAGGLVLGLAVLAACASGQEGAREPSMAGVTPAGSAQTAGFLTETTRPSALATIPPAPKEGEARNDLDWKIFRELRALEGSERWKLAQSDNGYQPKDLLADFSCSIGATLTPENAPVLASILKRTTQDAGEAAEGAKQVYKRTRPFLHNTPNNICIEKTDSLINSFDYPSGHASLGWTAGLVMAQLAPDRASQVLARGRAFGESRVVCGVHNMSAIEAGRTNAAGVFAALQGSHEFLAAMAKAREEVDLARKSSAKPDAAWCAKEAELIKPLVVQ